MMDSTRRFSDRAADYARHRPDYPEALLRDLGERGVLRPDSDWADIGAGTGIWTRRIAPFVRTVHAVEPNPEMRAEAAAFPAGPPNLRLSDGRAETTGLPAASCDGVTAAQAFHWFDRAAFRAECLRLLRPGGRVLLVRNDREADASDFMRAYRRLVQEHSGDLRTPNHREITPEEYAAFFGGDYELVEHPHRQLLDFEGLSGLLLSSSSAPKNAHPGHAPMMAALRRCFDQHAQNGRVAFAYTARARFGVLSPG